MPIYEYDCPVCRRRVEAFQRRPRESGERPPPCPRCGKRRLRAVFSRFSTNTDLSFPGFDSLDDVDSDDPESVAAWQRSAGLDDE